MTTEQIDTIQVAYTVAGAGPYPIPWTFEHLSELRVQARDDETLHDLTQGTHYTVAGSALSLTFVGQQLAVDGAVLTLWRETLREQGWEGLTAREAGVEAQLDALTRAVQDAREATRRGLGAPPGLGLPLDLTIDAMAPRAVVVANDLGTGIRMGPTLDELDRIPGPIGPQGPQGIQGPRGFTGDIGPPGNYFGLTLIGSSTDIADRPASASDGEGWGLIGDGTMTLYVWSSAAGGWLEGANIGLPAEVPVYGTVYVSPGGDDDRAGRTRSTAVRTLEAGLSIAASDPEVQLVHVGVGVYVTEGMLDVPDHVSVIGESRSHCFVDAAAGHETANVFRLGSGSYLSGFTGRGWQVDDLDTPAGGFLCAFRPGAVITRSPYAFNVVMHRDVPMPLVSAPHDAANGNPLVGNGGGVILADGAVLSAYSPIRNFMAWGATPSCPNGIGYRAANRAHINAVNAIAVFCHRGFVADSGGNIVASACSSHFGDWSLDAHGSSLSIKPDSTTGPLTVEVAAADAVQAARQAIIDSTWAALVAGGYTATWTAADETFTRTDTGWLLTALDYALRSGQEAPLSQFAMGMFDHAADPVFASAKLAAFVFAFEHVRDAVNALAIPASAQAMVTGLIAALVSTVQSPTTRVEPSTVEAINHQWTFPGAGVTRWALPAIQGGGGAIKRLQDTVRQRSGGIVRYSGQDNLGNAVFVGGLEINALTGELGGPPFDRAVRRIALETLNTRS